jgi:hypothetical protein
MDYFRIALQECTTTIRRWLGIKESPLTVIPCMTIWMESLREGRITPEEFRERFAAAYRPPRDTV